MSMTKKSAEQGKARDRRSALALTVACGAVLWLVYLTLIPLRAVRTDTLIVREVVLVNDAGEAAGWFTMSGSTPGLSLLAGPDQLVGLRFDTAGEPELFLYGTAGEITASAGAVKLDLHRASGGSVSATVPQRGESMLRVAGSGGPPQVIRSDGSDAIVARFGTGPQGERR